MAGGARQNQERRRLGGTIFSELRDIRKGDSGVHASQVDATQTQQAETPREFRFAAKLLRLRWVRSVRLSHWPSLVTQQPCDCGFAGGFSRGPVVDPAALTEEVLREQRIAGAVPDVSERIAVMLQ